MHSKVLLVGIDAMDPVIFGRMRQQLPNFSRLNFSTLQTSVPPETPVAWSTLATGCNPGKFGIYDFLTRDPKTYRPRLNLATEKPGLLKTTYQCAMRGTPVWRILSDNGVAASVLRWPVTFPPEKVSGRMLSGLGVVDLRGLLNSYTFFSTDPADLRGEGAAKVTPVVVKDGRVTTELSGPFARRKGQITTATTTLDIEAGDAGVTIRIGGNEFSLGVSEWSDLHPASFRPLAFVEIRGQVAFYLASVSPHLRLFATTVQFDPNDPFLAVSHPKEYSAELAAAIGRFHTLGMPEETKAVTDGLLSREAFLGQVKRIEAERLAMLRHELARFREGFLAVIFDAGDRLKHIFWETGCKTTGEIPKAIADYYLEKDAMLGEVLDGIDAGTRLLVVSDHGFHDFSRQVNLNQWLLENGYLAASAPGGELFEQVDWSRTRAFAVGFTSIFLNIAGREGKGAVGRGSEEDALLAEISRKLADLRDAGESRVVTEVYLGRDLYHGEFAAEAPDLVVGFEPGYRASWKSAVGAMGEPVIADNDGFWTGDHLIDRSHVPGVLFTNFERKTEACSLLDVAPTVLRLLNQPIPAAMDGRSLV